MKELIEKSLLDEDNVINFFLTNHDVFPERSLKFIEDGVERYFKEDFMRAIHISVPQIEAILRRRFVLYIAMTFFFSFKTTNVPITLLVSLNLCVTSSAQYHLAESAIGQSPHCPGLSVHSSEAQ